MKSSYLSSTACVVSTVAPLPAAEKCSMQLSSAQLEDFKDRLLSIKKHGIINSKEAAHKFKKIITSSDRRIDAKTCLNVVDLSEGDRTKIRKALVCDNVCGINNMAIERHNYILCKEMNEFKSHLQERLACSYVFILDTSRISDLTYTASFTEKTPKPIAHLEHIADMAKEVYVGGIQEYHAVKPISADAVIAIMVPDGLETIASEVFPDKKIISVPFYEGDFTLAGFTLFSALDCKTMPNDGVAKNVIAPHYEAAFIDFFIKNPNLKRFATHLSRFATEHDLQYPITQASNAMRAPYDLSRQLAYGTKYSKETVFSKARTKFKGITCGNQQDSKYSAAITTKPQTAIEPSATPNVDLYLLGRKKIIVPAEVLSYIKANKTEPF